MRILIFIPLFLLAGCGVFRNVDKHKEVHEVKTTFNTDSVTKVKTITKDQSKTVIEEKAKGTVKPPAVTAEWYTPFDSDSTVRHFFLSTEQGTVSIVASLNKLGTGLDHKATFDPNPVDFDIDKKTTTENNIETKEETNTQVSNQESNEVKDKVSDVKKEGKNAVWFVVLGVGIAAVIIFSVFKYFKR